MGVEANGVGFLRWGCVQVRREGLMERRESGRNKQG